MGEGDKGTLHLSLWRLQPRGEPRGEPRGLKGLKAKPPREPGPPWDHSGQNGLPPPGSTVTSVLQRHPQRPAAEDSGSSSGHLSAS